MTLPLPLQAAAEARLATQSGDRRKESAALTAAYKAGGSSAAVDLGAYLATRMPATFAAVERVLAEVARLRPGFAPASLLDAGSGPGTASWACLQHWPGLQSVTFLDDHPAFLALAKDLARAGPPQLAAAAALRGRIEALPAGLEADLTVAAYALAELPVAAMAAAADRLWHASRQLLVLVEPGTPQGFARLRACRSRLVAAGAVPVAPCTHALDCPLEGGDWCHFSVRLPRLRAHMHAKAASVPFEDERFAYLVLARDGTPPAGGRVIAPPHRAKPGMSLRLCTQGSVEVRHIARRDASAYKRLRKCEWGDLVGAPDQQEDGQ